MAKQVGWGGEIRHPSRGAWYSRYSIPRDEKSSIQFVNRETKEVVNTKGKTLDKEPKYRTPYGADKAIRNLKGANYPTRVGKRIVTTPRPANPIILPR